MSTDNDGLRIRIRCEWENALECENVKKRLDERVRRGLRGKLRADRECGCGGPEGHVPGGIWCRT